MVAPTVAAQSALHVARLLANCVRSVEDLTVEQLHHLPTDRANSIGFDVWHVARTVDNVVFFVFDREQPIWVRDGFDERFGLPRVAQGTGMTDAEAHALRFPAPPQFIEYIRAVETEVLPRLAAMSPEYLAEPVLLKPWGESPRMEHIGQVLIAHGNGHIGRVSMARALLGKNDLGI